MDLQLKGKRALVTGGSRGIGKAIAFALAREGADVVIVARDKKALGSASEEISKATGRRIKAVAADTGDAAAVKAMAGEALAGSGFRLASLVGRDLGPGQRQALLLRGPGPRHFHLETTTLGGEQRRGQRFGQVNGVAAVRAGEGGVGHDESDVMATPRAGEPASIIPGGPWPGRPSPCGRRRRRSK